MSHETEVGFFESVHAHHPSVHTLEPKFDVRGSAKTITTKFDADFIFGPEHQNDEAPFYILPPTPLSPKHLILFNQSLQNFAVKLFKLRL